MIIGLAGGIGSGKSTLAQGLRQLGYSVYDTDKEAKRILTEDSHVRQAVVALLGNDVYEETTYRTDIVAERVFADSALLNGLNAIVHPAVKEDIVRAAQEVPVLFVESAILYESGLSTICDKVVAVIASKKIRIERVLARDCTDINKVRARVKAQISNCQLKQRADIVVMNDGKKSIDQLCQYIVRHL